MHTVSNNIKCFSAVYIVLFHCYTNSELIPKTGSDTTCAIANFVHLGESKFYYSEIKQSWEQAQTECKSYGMKIATIRSSAENNRLGLRLMETFIDTLKPRAQKVWIGAKDTNKQGIYEWADGSPMLYMNYGSPRPDSDTGKSICLHVGFPAQGSNYLQWKQDDCRKQRPFICETDKKECFTEDDMAINPSIIKIFGTKYFLNLQRLNWADALEFCEAQHLRLISFNSRTTNDEIANILARQHQLPADFSFWTSGSHHILDYNEDKPLWLSSGVIADGDWNAWAKDEPSDQGFSSPNRRCRTRTELCVEARLLPQGKIEWAASDCMRPLPFVCTKPSACQLESGVVVTNHTSERNTKEQKGRSVDLKSVLDAMEYQKNRDGNKMHMVQKVGDVSMGKKLLNGFFFSYFGRKYFASKSTFHWRDALKFCQSKGMDLYSSDSDYEHKEIADFVWRFKTAKSCKFWMSGIDLGTPSKYIWIGSGTPVPENKTYFNETTPKQIARPTCLYLQLCNSTVVTEKDVKWKVQACHDPKLPKINCICEQKKGC